jgi:hypothetical protein
MRDTARETQKLAPPIRANQIKLLAVQKTGAFAL